MVLGLKEGTYVSSFFLIFCRIVLTRLFFPAHPGNNKNNQGNDAGNQQYARPNTSFKNTSYGFTAAYSGGQQQQHRHKNEIFSHCIFVYFLQTAGLVIVSYALSASAIPSSRLTITCNWLVYWYSIFSRQLPYIIHFPLLFFARLQRNLWLTPYTSKMVRVFSV